MTDVGFEPTPPKRLVPKTSALDHSANQSITIAQFYMFFNNIEIFSKTIRFQVADIWIKLWGISSIGRVRRSQRRGSGIETRILHIYGLVV